MSWTISRYRGANPTSSSNPIDQSFFFNSVSKSTFQKNKKSALNFDGRSSRSLQYLSMSMNLQTASVLRQSHVNNTLPGPHLLSGFPSGPMRKRIMGLVLTFGLPYFTHKYGSWLLLKMDPKTLKATEQVMKSVGSVADKIDKGLDFITDRLPQGIQIKKTLEFVDKIVERVAKTAHGAADFIKKSCNTNEWKQKAISKNSTTHDNSGMAAGHTSSNIGPDDHHVPIKTIIVKEPGLLDVFSPTPLAIDLNAKYIFGNRDEFQVCNGTSKEAYDAFQTRTIEKYGDDFPHQITADPELLSDTQSQHDV